ncbi:hypothetical protein ACFFLM_06045 [Deinococcus oregonensis]|uniref:Uncharacterized protein n=1 Tax=Deinococcus oregonensis TaxID=1805970 RepID=A0ABV6AVK6_9DEIO
MSVEVYMWRWWHWLSVLQTGGIGCLVFLAIMAIPIFIIFAYPTFWLGIVGATIALTLLPSYLWKFAIKLSGFVGYLARFMVIVVSVGAAYFLILLALSPFMPQI